MLSGEIVRMDFVAAAAGSKCLSLFDKKKWKIKIPLSENSAEFFTLLRCLPVLLWKAPGDALIYPGTSLPFHDAASLRSVRNN